MPDPNRRSRRHPDPGSYDAEFWDRALALPGQEATAVAEAAPAPPPSPSPATPPRVPAARQAPAPPSAPPPAPPPARPHAAAPGPVPARKRRRRWLRIVALLLGLVVISAAAFGARTWRTWGRVERVEVSPVLSAAVGPGTNYLLVGSDSREGITEDDPNAAALIGEEIVGQRSDTVMVLRVGDDGARFLSLPRDLWLPIAGTGGEQRLNSAFAQGPETLIRTVTESLGIPVHHYVEIDLATFADVVDAMGGVAIDFANPAFDRASGLDVPTAGTVVLDGPQALAYVRSRQYTEVIDGTPAVDPTGDLGRGLRQQAFLRTVLDQAADTRNPATAARLFGAVSSGITVDDTLDLGQVIDLALSLRGQSPESVELPVYNWTTGSGAAVLGLADGADLVLARFG